MSSSNWVVSIAESRVGKFGLKFGLAPFWAPLVPSYKGEKKKYFGLSSLNSNIIIWYNQNEDQTKHEFFVV